MLFGDFCRLPDLPGHNHVPAGNAHLRHIHDLFIVPDLCRNKHLHAVAELQCDRADMRCSADMLLDCHVQEHADVRAQSDL
jgi:hypothetical protein